MGYLWPVPFTYMSTWQAHRNRSTPSSEPGCDLFCPIGTPVLAPADGMVVDVGDSIEPATGRYVTVDFDDGRRFRALHLSSRVVGQFARVSRGDVIAYSGASGYGEEDWSWNVAETGGAHVHMTLWRTQRYVFGSSATLDPELYFTDRAGSLSGGNATSPEEDDMPKFVTVKDDRGNFAIVRPDGVGRILSGTQLRGAQKIARGANGGDLPEVDLSGEEWDAGSLDPFVN